ncbi:hypothetical protein ACFZCY_06105 [Streptomyces sp. NPDC007983]|uniref:hypothetical protein n=1 Tax=Streptomyces sp. NPDC007983 TaxID=3364800 RepID=UPI0036E2856A
MTGMTPGPALRTTRAAIFAVVCVVMAALGHAVMSGGTVPGWMLGAAFLATASAAWWLTGRQRGGAVVTGATVGAQMALHLLFHFSQSSRLAQAPMGHGAHGAHGGGGMSGGPGMNGMDGMAGMADAHMASAADGITPGMLLAHALAALVCGLWLWCGEAAAFRLGRALAAAVFVPLRLVLRLLGADALPLPTRRLPWRPGAGRALRAALLHYVVARRGPPEGLVRI